MYRKLTNHSSKAGIWTAAIETTGTEDWNQKNKGRVVPSETISR